MSLPLSLCVSAFCCVSTRLYLCLSFFFHYLCLFTSLSLSSLSLSLFVSVSLALSFTSYPSPATTAQHMWAGGSSLPSPHPWQPLKASQSWPLLPAPLGLGGGGRRRKGGQPGGPTPFCLSRPGGWASGPFNQPGQAVPDTSPGRRAWLPWCLAPVVPAASSPPARPACNSSPHQGPWPLQPSQPSPPTAT